MSVLASSIDVDQILHYVDMGSLIAFIVVLALLLLLFLRGLLRGWKQGTYRLIVLGILTAIPLCMIGLLANWLGQFDLGQFIKDPISITVNKQTTQLQVTSLFDTLYRFIYWVLHDAYHIKSSPEAIANYSIAMAGSIVRLLLVVVIGIIMSTVVDFLVWILWHLIFKRFSAKENRKPKVRVVSAIEEVLVYVAFLVIIVTPLSGLVNSVKNNAALPEESDNDTISLVKNVLDTYEKSIFNQAFFAWTKGSGRDTIDTQIAQFIAQNSYVVDSQTYQANVINEFRVLAGVEGDLVKLMAAETPEQSLVGSLLHSSILVGEALYSIALNSDYLTDSLVPLVYEVADNIDAISYDYSGLSNEETLSSSVAMGRTFMALASNSYLSCVEDPVYDTVIPLYSDDAITPLAKARVDKRMAEDPKAKAKVNALISGYVHRDLSVNPDSPFAKYFGKEADFAAVSEVDWVKESLTLQSCRDHLFELEPSLKADSSSVTDEALMKTFLNVIAHHPLEVIDLLVGKRTEAGVPITDDYGNNKDSVCLLDSDLVSVLLPAALEIGASYLDEQVLDANDPLDFLDRVGDIAAELQGKSTADTKKGYKEELGHVLDVVGKFANTEVGGNFLLHYDEMPGVNFATDGTLISIDPELVRALKVGVVCIDSSKLLAYAGPVVADHFSRDLLAEGGSLSQLGIKTLDFHCNGFGAELSHFLDIGVYCGDMISIIGPLLSGGTLSYMNILAAMTNLESDEGHYQITHLMDILTSSRMVNPDIEKDGKVYKNSNVAGLFNGILKMAMGNEDIRIDPDILSDLDMESGWNDDVIDKDNLGESYYVVAAFKVILESGVVDKIADIGSSSPAQAVQTLANLDVESLFSSIGASVVLRKSVSPFFDQYFIGTMLNNDKAIDFDLLGITYKNLITEEDWVQEGIAMQSILNLATRGLDLSNLDFFSPSVIELMKLVSQSRMFFLPVTDESGAYVLDENGDVARDYRFSAFFGEKILVSMTSDDQIKLLCDYPHKVLESGKTVYETLDSINLGDKDSLDDKKECCTTLLRSLELLDTPEAWSDEFDTLASAITMLSAAGGADALSTIKAKDVPMLMGTIRRLNDCQSLGGVLVSNVFYKTLSSDSLPDIITGGDMNHGYFYRNAEDTLTAKEALKEATTEEAKDAQRAIITELTSKKRTQLDLLLNVLVLTVGNEAIHNESGQIDLNLANLSVEGLLRPMMMSCTNSKIFNPTSPADLYLPTDPMPTFTVFENLILNFLEKSEMFVDSSDVVVKDEVTAVKGTNKTLKDIVLGVANWDLEIDNFLNVIETIQSSMFVKDGTIDFSPLTKDIAAFFDTPGAADELRDMVTAIESSELLYRCLAPKLQKALDDSLTSMTLENIAEDLSCADFYLYSPGMEGVDFNPYSSETVDNLIDVFADMSKLKDIKMSDLATMDVGAVCGALSSMGQSEIFNKNTSKSSTVFGTTHPERTGFTCFQCLCCDLLHIDAVDTYFYYAQSEKDIAAAGSGLYTTSDEKMAYIVKSHLPSLATATKEATAEACDKYIGGELAEVLFTVKQDRFSGFIDGSATIDSLDEGTLVILLNTLNDCTFYRDCVPNAFHKILIQDGNISVQGIDLSAADIYFSYYYHDNAGEFSPTRKVEPNYDMPFYGPEIDQLAMLYKSLKDNQAIFSNLSIGSIDPMLIRNVLLDLSDSYVFHIARAENRRPYHFCLDDATTENPNPPKVFEDMTVFESFINKVLIDTTLYQRNYNSGKDYNYALRALSLGKDTDYGAYLKLHDDILNVTASSNWLDEIGVYTTDGLHHEGTDADPYIGLIETGQKIGIFGSGSEVAVGFDAMKKMSPKTIKSLLYALNDSVILNDVIPGVISEMLGENNSGAGLSLSQYSDMSISKDIYDGLTEIDLSQATYLYDDENLSSSFHAISKMTLNNVLSDIAGHYHVYLCDSPTNPTDITALVSSEYDSGTHKATLHVSNIPGPYRFVFDSAVSGSVEMVIPMADFYIGSEGYRTKAIPALGYFLASAYRGVEKPNGDPREQVYFSFSGSSATISALFNEKNVLDDSGQPLSNYDHSTYGVFVLFTQSGFYKTSFDDHGKFTANPEHIYYTSAEKTIGNVLKFTISAPVNVTIDLEAYGYGHISLPANATLSFTDLIGKGTTTEEHLHALKEALSTFDMSEEGIGNYVREARWFDLYAADVGTFALYNEFYEIIFNTNEIENDEHVVIDISHPLIRTLLYQQVDNQFGNKALLGSGLSAIEKMLPSFSSTVYSYEGENAMIVPLSDVASEQLKYEAHDVSPNLGRSVMANLVTNIGQYKSDTVKLGTGMSDSDPLFIVYLNAFSTSPSLQSIGNPAGSFRKFQVDGEGNPVYISSFDYRDDLFADNFAKLSPQYLSDVGTDFLLLNELVQDTPDKSVAADLFNALHDDGAGYRNDFNSLFYLTTLYDRIVRLGVYKNAGNIFSPIFTDFNSLIASGYDGGASTPFSYGAIATVFANA